MMAIFPTTPKQSRAFLLGAERLLTEARYGINITPAAQEPTVDRIKPEDAPPHVWHRIAEDANRLRVSDRIRAVEPHEILDLIELYKENQKNNITIYDYEVNMFDIMMLARTYGMDV